MAIKKNEDDNPVDVEVDPAADKPAKVVDTSGWVEAPTYTGRPSDKPTSNSTFAERAKAQGRNKRVETADKK